MTQQMQFPFVATVDAATTVRHAGKDKHTSPALYTFVDGCMVRKQNQPQTQTVDWSAMAEEAALPLEPVADDEIFAVKH